MAFIPVDPELAARVVLPLLEDEVRLRDIASNYGRDYRRAVWAAVTSQRLVPCKPSLAPLRAASVAVRREYVKSLDALIEKGKNAA